MPSRNIVTYLLFIFALLLTSCYKTTHQRNLAFPAEKKMFTSYNMWYTKWDKLYAINYKKGNILPAGTAVKNVKIRRGKSVIDGNQQVILFTDAQTNQYYVVHFQNRFHPGKTIKDYLDYLFTEKDFKGLTTTFTEEEILAIRSGIVEPGMSKQAVLVSWGYPPEHQNYSLDENIWSYWMSRFEKKEILFNDQGKVVAGGDN